MKVRVFDEFFFHGWRVFTISFMQWLALKKDGELQFCKGKPNGFTGETIFYLVKCEKHGYYLSYEQGYVGYNNVFPCPFCLKKLYQRLETK